MKLKIIVFFLFFLSLILLSSTVYAQEEEPGQAFVCLNADQCACGDRDGATCSTQVESCHSAQINSEGNSFPVNTDIYIFECITWWTDVDNVEQTGQICTTGNSTIDISLFGEDNNTWLKDNLYRHQTAGGRDEWYDYGYDFRGLFYSDGSGQASNPIRFTDSFPVLEWSSFTPAGTSREFYAFYYIPTIDGGGEEVVVEQDDEMRTQQQGTMELTTFPTPTVSMEDKDCAIISWDPYGRIFDNRSLEPIPESVVELQKKRNDGNFTKVNPADPKDVPSTVLRNPYITDSDGYFSFIVKDGTYKLDLPSKYNRDISIVTDLSKINSNYSKIYSDIYPGQTGIEIIQLGNIQHRDISVETKGEPANYPVKLMGGSYDLGKKSGKLYVSGRASHPFTMIKAYSKKISSNQAENVRGQLLQTISSDNFGRFSITINQNGLNKDEYFGEIELEKTDLTTFQLSGNKKIVAVNPILNYIEGYAYDEKGKVIPNAIVSIYFTFSSKPFYKTLADDKGYYRISSVNLPSIPYNIEYLLPNGQTVKINAIKFINSNAQYLITGKVNLYEENNKIKTPSLSFKSNTLNNQQPTDIVSDSQSNSKNDMILIVIIILALIIGAVVLIGVYLYQKDKKQPSF